MLIRLGLAASLATSLLLAPVPATQAQTTTSVEDDVVVVPPEPNHSEFFRSREDGWFWLKDPTLIKRPRGTEAAPSATNPRISRREQKRENRPRELVEFDRLKRITEEAHQIAIMNPTEANIYRYLRLLRFQMDKVSIYTDLAQHVAWKFPELSPSPDEARPANVLAMNTYDAQRAAERAQRLRTISQTHGIYFFFRSDCPYCHAYAPMLRAFAQQFGFAVLAISLDGRGIPGFEQFVRDNGTAAALNVKQWPTTFLVDPSTRDVLALGAGVMNVEELAERIFQLLQHREQSTQARVGARAASPELLTAARSQ